VPTAASPASWDRRSAPPDEPVPPLGVSEPPPLAGSSTVDTPPSTIVGRPATSGPGLRTRMRPARSIARSAPSTTPSPLRSPGTADDEPPPASVMARSAPSLTPSPLRSFQPAPFQSPARPPARSIARSAPSTMPSPLRSSQPAPFQFDSGPPERWIAMSAPSITPSPLRSVTPPPQAAPGPLARWIARSAPSTTPSPLRSPTPDSPSATPSGPAERSGPTFVEPFAVGAATSPPPVVASRRAKARSKNSSRLSAAARSHAPLSPRRRSTRRPLPSISMSMPPMPGAKLMRQRTSPDPIGMPTATKPCPRRIDASPAYASESSASSSATPSSTAANRDASAAARSSERSST
jgi:hypothetical protein